MRLFVALVPPADVLEDLARLVDHLRATAPDVDLRWATVEQWHLTLAFLGEVAEQRLPDLDLRLGRAAARSEGLSLRLSSGGGFGSAKAARVLWAGVGGDVQLLRRLADGVSAAARRSGVELDARRFRPHLTLARLKRPADLRELVQQLQAYAGPHWHATGIQLVRSHLGQGAGNRPRYETIGSWPLGRPAKSDGE